MLAVIDAGDALGPVALARANVAASCALADTHSALSLVL
jgi:hypothetical protein